MADEVSDIEMLVVTREPLDLEDCFRFARARDPEERRPEQHEAGADDRSLRFVDRLLAAPRARQLAPTPATWERLRAIATSDEQVRGPFVPDAWLAALALSHGCRLATADRGFARFAGLNWFVPVQPAADR